MTLTIIQPTQFRGASGGRFPASVTMVAYFGLFMRSLHRPPG